jgi:hypothetical protein
MGTGFRERLAGPMAAAAASSNQPTRLPGTSRGEDRADGENERQRAGEDGSASPVKSGGGGRTGQGGHNRGETAAGRTETRLARQLGAAPTASQAPRSPCISSDLRAPTMSDDTALAEQNGGSVRRTEAGPVA